MRLDLLKEEMSKKGMTNIMLSKASGIAPSTISRYLSGKRKISVVTARKLMEALNLSASKAKSIFFE